MKKWFRCCLLVKRFWRTITTQMFKKIAHHQINFIQVFLFFQKHDLRFSLLCLLRKASVLPLHFLHELLDSLIVARNSWFMCSACNFADGSFLNVEISLKRIRSGASVWQEIVLAAEFWCLAVMRDFEISHKYSAKVVISSNI